MTSTLAIITPLAGAFILPLIYIAKKDFLRWGSSLAGILSLTATLSAVLSGWRGPEISLTGGWPPEIGIALVVDPLSAIFLLLAAMGFAAVLVCSRKGFDENLLRYYVLIFLSWASTNGILCTGDLFNLFVFYEIFSVSAYLLVAFSSTSWQAVEAGFKYLVFGTVGALLFLLGTAYVFIATGLLNLALLPEALARAPMPTVTTISGCLLLALFIKTGTFPAHFWLPDAHSSARTAVSALLSGVLVKVSIYVLLRLSSLLFLRIEPRIFPIVLAAGSTSLLIGHLMACRQRDIKRLLAYSTVAQVGYILIGVGCASAAGFSAAVYHAFNHMAAKMGLFLTAGVLADDAESRNITDLAGLGRHRPLTCLAFAFFASSLVGIPPLNGFTSKWFLILASIEAGHAIPAILLIAGTVISAGYYFNILRFLISPGKKPKTKRSSPLTSSVVGALLLLCLVLTILPFVPAIWKTLAPIGTWIADSSAYIEAVTNP